MAASSPDNRDIERSEAGSMQSPPEAFARAHWAFHFSRPYGKSSRSRIDYLGSFCCLDIVMSLECNGPPHGAAGLMQPDCDYVVKQVAKPLVAFA
jgi:hypothetical protein